MKNSDKNLEKFVRRNIVKAKILNFCSRYMYFPVIVLIALIISLAADALWPYLKPETPVNDEEFVKTYISTESSESESVKKLNSDEIPTKININTADAAMFDTLPGIGMVKAERIVQLREQMGGFRSVEDLLNVEGVGEKILSKIKDKLYIE